MQQKTCVFKDYVEHGMPPVENFPVQSGDLPSIKDNEALVELVYISVDPYMRGRMRNIKGYMMPPFSPGKPMNSHAVAVVKESKLDKLPVGTYVSGYLPWQTPQVVTAQQAGSLYQIDTSLLKSLKLPLSVMLGVMGATGVTAYYALANIGKPKSGETIFVSAAAGAVGMVVCQICKNVYGCRVVGSAGSDEKIAMLKDKGFVDEAFNYKTKDTLQALQEYCPKGIDLYFDNVGGQTLEATLELCNNFARVMACGSISQYNSKDTERYGVKNLFHVVTKRVLMQGFIAGDHLPDILPEFKREMSQWLKDGKVHHMEHVEGGGLEAAGQAFVALMEGKNTGKMVVQCGDDPFRI